MQNSSAEMFRQIILDSQLPPEIAANIRGRSRVAVRTIRDLEIYTSFVEGLCTRFEGVYGHKKAISDLIGVSTNRISEWQRLWTAAMQSSSPAVRRMIDAKDVALSELIAALRDEGDDKKREGPGQRRDRERRDRKSAEAEGADGDKNIKMAKLSSSSFTHARPQHHQQHHHHHQQQQQQQQQQRQQPCRAEDQSLRLSNTKTQPPAHPLSLSPPWGANHSSTCTLSHLPSSPTPNFNLYPNENCSPGPSPWDFFLDTISGTGLDFDDRGFEVGEGESHDDDNDDTHMMQPVRAHTSTAMTSSAHHGDHNGDHNGDHDRNIVSGSAEANSNTAKCNTAPPHSRPLSLSMSVSLSGPHLDRGSSTSSPGTAPPATSSSSPWCQDDDFFLAVRDRFEFEDDVSVTDLAMHHSGWYCASSSHNTSSASNDFFI